MDATPATAEMSEEEARKVRGLRNLAQYRDKTDEELLAMVRERAARKKDDGRTPDVIDPRAILDLSLNLPPKLRTSYKDEVERTLGEMGKDVRPELARPAVEIWVLHTFLVRIEMAHYARTGRSRGSDKDARALDLLVSRYWASAEHLEFVTPRGVRLGKRTPQEHVLSAIAAAQRVLADARETKVPAADLEARYGRLPAAEGETEQPDE